MSFCKVILMGRLGSDPELRYTAANKEVCTLSVATSDGFGENEKTTWHRCIVWGKAGKTIHDHLHKGDAILLEGTLRMNEWRDNRSGDTRKQMEMHCWNFTFLPKPRDTNASPRTEPARQAAPQSAPPGPGPAVSADDPLEFDDDIPF